MIAEDGFCLWWGEDVGAGNECLGFTIPEALNGIVRATGKVSAMERMVRPGIVELTLMCQLDLQMVLPQWLVNFFTRKVGWHAAKQFRELCLNLPEEHQQKIAEDKTGIYGSLKERANVLLAKKDSVAVNTMKVSELTN